MLTNAAVMPTIPVVDLARARAFDGSVFKDAAGNVLAVSQCR
jgi:hypothetical protein